MILHYSRTGYNGNFTYTSVCGEQVKTHQDTESSTIHPELANCEKCLKTKEHTIDLNDLKTHNITRRIYIESDILKADEFRSAQRHIANYVKDNGGEVTDRVFSEVLDRAWHDLDKTWASVKDADEIYATTSLMPIIGNSYTGAPVIFDGMCERAVKEDLRNKKVFILNSLDNIYWDMIDGKTFKKAFKHNELYMYDENNDLTKINVSKIKVK